MIQIALSTEFKLAKEAQTIEIVGAVYAGFLQAQLNGPVVRFTMEEGTSHKMSSIERVLKRFPEMKQFDHVISRPWGLGGQTQEARRIGNDADSPVVGASVEISTLLEITAGIPKRYPFFSAVVRVTDPAFGDEPSANTGRVLYPGLTIADRWGLSKRRTTLSALTIVEADPASDVPPTPAASVAAVLDACGQHSRPKQIVLPGQDSISTERVAAIARDLKTCLGEIVKRARMPHDFSNSDDHPSRQPANPRKPILVRFFRPLGYDCRGEGMMILVCSRRTTSNITVRLHLDFGTWGSHVHPTYSVHGLGFSVAIRLPVCPSSGLRGVNWIVDETHWGQIVENLAALVAELDRSVVPAIEGAAGPAPSWYEPDVASGPTYSLIPPTVSQDQ